jgi:glycine oxidase
MIVIGAGIIGLSCAWRLAQKGLAVTVFDAREAGAEASWAGAGMLAPGGEVDENSAFARMCLASLRQYAAFVEELQSASGIEIDYQRCGAIEVAVEEAEIEALNARARALESVLGIRSEDAGAGRRFFPDDAVVDPRDVTAALRIACERLGVRIVEHHRIEKLPEGQALIAAGAWSSEVSDAIPKVTPVRGHLIGYDMPPGTLPHILRRGHTYLLQRRNGLLIAGATTERVGLKRDVDDAAVADIESRAAQLLPSLRDCRPGLRWNGFRPKIEENMPFIGRIPGTATLAAIGHYRNGILLAPETARLISELVPIE